MTTVAFLPGLNNDARVWDPVIAAMPDSAACVALDLPALGEVDAIAQAVAARLPATFVVVGHSFGGVVAMALLAQFPERVRGMCLVNTPQGTDSPDMAKARVARGARAVAGELEEMTMGRVDLVYYGDNANDEKILAERLRSVRAYGAERYAAHSAAIATRPDRADLLTATSTPIAIVAAEMDLVVPTAEQRQWAERIGAGWICIPRTGHMLPAEEPVELAEQLSQWIDDLS